MVDKKLIRNNTKNNYYGNNKNDSNNSSYSNNNNNNKNNNNDSSIASNNIIDYTIDDAIDNNDESKYIDIIADHISSAILRLKSKELLQLNRLRLNQQTISSIQLNHQSNQPIQSNNSIIQFIPNNIEMQSRTNISDLQSKTFTVSSLSICETKTKQNKEEITGLNETPKLNQHTTEIKQVDYDDSYFENCNGDYNYDCYEDCNDNNNHKNKSFHDFDNKKDL